MGAKGKLFIETGFLYVSLAILELALYTNQAGLKLREELKVPSHLGLESVLSFYLSTFT